MNSEEFNGLVALQISICQQMLVKKGGEYATADRLHNFRVAAKMQGISMRQALSGMMAKHSVSLYDMLGTDELYSLEVWNEKITDHINYLLILSAMVTEELQDHEKQLSDLREKLTGQDGTDIS